MNTPIAKNQYRPGLFHEQIPIGANTQKINLKILVNNGILNDIHFTFIIPSRLSNCYSQPKIIQAKLKVIACYWPLADNETFGIIKFILL